jgi:hypothetical protein
VHWDSTSILVKIAFLVDHGKHNDIPIAAKKITPHVGFIEESAKIWKKL